MWGKFLANSGMGNNLLPESQIKSKESVSHTRAFVSLYLRSEPVLEIASPQTKPKKPNKPTPVKPKK